MTSLRINTDEFKRVCGVIRSDIGMFDASEESIYSFYRFFVKDMEHRIFAKAPEPAAELRTALKIASRAAMEFGATEAQIDFIVKMATKRGELNVLSGGRLTKKEASRIIEEMKK